MVAVLSVTEITSWGVLYYAFAALHSSISDDTGWSSVAVTGAFSLSQIVSALVGVWVGRHIDAYGPRRVMTVGSLLTVPGLLAVGLAGSLPVFYAGWLLTGVAMAGTLYPPAFAALTHWAGPRRVAALTTLTLVGGLASTVFAPLASLLEDHLGWRGTYLALLCGLVVLTVPLHAWGLAQPWRPHRRPAPSSPGVDVAGITRSRPFVLLTVGTAVTALSVFAVVINLVPALVEQGMSRDLAAVALGLGGAGQVLGRLGYARFAAVTTPTSRLVVVTLAVALATAALAVSPPVPVLLIGWGMVLGLARGAYTLVQATAVTDRWGPRGYGAVNGVLTAPSLVAAASAPFVGAALATLLGELDLGLPGAGLLRGRRGPPRGRGRSATG